MRLRDNAAYHTLLESFFHQVRLDYVPDLSSLDEKEEWCTERWGPTGARFVSADLNAGVYYREFLVTPNARWASMDFVFFFRYGRDAMTFKMFWC